MKKTRICINCKIKNPSLKKTGIGSMMKSICLTCGKDAGFVFIQMEKK